MHLAQTVMDEPARSPTPPQEADDQPPPCPSGRTEVEIFDASGRMSPHDLAALRDLTTRALARLGAAGSVRVRLVNDDEMSRAHQRHTGVGGTTDVLTFDLAPHDDDPQNAPLDADLFVCADQARRQGEALGHDTRREILLYIVHGILHCLGYDDHAPGDYRAMHDKEDEVLAAIGVGATFFTPPAPRAPGARS